MYTPVLFKIFILQQIYFKALSEGFLLGFGLAFLIGPAFFALLQASIDHGFGVSVALALGVVCSDVLLMGLSYGLMAQLDTIPYFNVGLAVLGGLVLIFSGISAMVNSQKQVAKISFSMKEVGKLFIKGFSINTFNPFPWMFWFSTAAMVEGSYAHYGWTVPFLFFAAAAITVFATDALKAWAAQFLIHHLTYKILRSFKVVSGICLIGFGVRLFYFAFEAFYKN